MKKQGERAESQDGSPIGTVRILRRHRHRQPAMTQDIVPPAITELLEASGLDYEVMPCDPEFADTAVFCEHYGCPLEDSVNTIVVKAKTGAERYAACALLADTRLDVNRCVRKRLASRRVSFASAEETARVTGMTIGGVTPLGLPADLPLWVDSRIMERVEVILGGGTRRSKIRVSPAIFERTPGVEIVHGLALVPGA